VSVGEGAIIIFSRKKLKKYNCHHAFLSCSFRIFNLIFKI
jgi:hypothetical protein